MASELVFYTNPMSRGRIVRWMLEETGVPYRTEIMDFGAPMKGDFLSINPMGKVPAIRHGDAVVTEAAAICLHLAEAFPEAGLAPAVGSPERAAYYRWAFFAAGPIEAAVTNRSCGFTPTSEQSGMLGYGNYEMAIATLESHLARMDYVAGSRFSAADVYVGSQVGWGMQFRTIEKRPAFEAYWDRLKDRPAAVRARRIDDDLLAERKSASA